MWGFLTTNPQIEETMQKERQHKFEKLIKNAKSSIKTSRPQSHRVINNSKKKQIKDERDMQIFQENQILLKKMVFIDSKPSGINTFRTTSAKLKGRSNSRTQQQIKIFQENQRLLRKLQSTNSHYSIAKLEEENRQRHYMMLNICKKSKRVMSKTDRQIGGNDLIAQILKRRKERMRENQEF
ncbi:hypothetical protein SteCoe_2704 [Stentor coeruleus]|uniref:Uncharacterized protein n=1 Tax=Stentor coeruleus TaxID=5963 RepID=A0A1R2CYY0_9CILI|nr:hypothetical protein SteCoe_2704 [Stentor coeruleus]